uniref:Uncharacterized protein n=1 Tax=Vespula pensylvanica TaxID=30213 RepID=A0A834KCP6_VESPE|nr:hypothetical protein H0235_014967 [Vespula pensylvanica]
MRIVLILAVRERAPMKGRERVEVCEARRRNEGAEREVRVVGSPRSLRSLADVHNLSRDGTGDKDEDRELSCAGEFSDWAAPRKSPGQLARQG